MSEITSGGVTFDAGNWWDDQGALDALTSMESVPVADASIEQSTAEIPDLQKQLDDQQSDPYSAGGPDLQALISQQLGTGETSAKSSNFLSDLLKSASSADKDTKNLVGNVVGGLLLSAAGLGKQDREMRQTRELLAQKDEYTQAAEKRAAARLANAKVKKEGWGFSDTGLLSAALQQKASK